MFRRVALSISALVLAAVLLLNFQGPGQFTTGALGISRSSGSGSVAAVGSDSGSTSGSGTGSASGSSSSSSSGSTSSSSSGSGSGSGSLATTPPATGSARYTGNLIATPYGDVQVRITVSDGVITDVRAIALPVGGHSGRISSIVEPMLRSEAMTAKSAAINIISGATYTSLAYAQSLQSAIDTAGL
jgi:uncharacterized protein with FMN-binding domain